METGTDKIQAGIYGSVGWLVFNNAEKHNALSLSMAEAARKVVEAYEADGAVRVIALRGNGGKAFVSGADISEFKDHRATAEASAEFERKSGAFFAAVRNASKPTVAMIEGYCMGGGVGLACACDLRIANQSAVFAIPAGRLGIGYRPTMTRWVVDAVGPANAKEILLTARRYNSEEALLMGLIHRRIDDKELPGFVDSYTAAIADNAPLSLRAAKFIINELSKGTGEADMVACEELVRSCTDSDDYTEGRTAFMEKRKPEFTGR